MYAAKRPKAEHGAKTPLNLTVMYQLTLNLEQVSLKHLPPAKQQAIARLDAALTLLKDYAWRTLRKGFAKDLAVHGWMTPNAMCLNATLDAAY